MLLIFIVIGTAFVAIYIKTSADLKSTSINTMMAVIHSSRPNAPGDDILPPKHGFEEDRPSLPTYIIHINDKDNTCIIEGFGPIDQLTNEDIQFVNDLINEVNNQNTDEGILKDYNLRFLVHSSPFGRKIVFLDKTYEDNNLHQLLVYYLIIGTTAFIAFLIISIVFASIAVRPIENSMRQQQSLISDVSHELKTPIAIITTNTDIVLSHNDATVEDEKKWLGYIKDETIRMSKLVEMMLYLAKTDEHGTKPILSAVDLSNLAYEVALPFESVCFENRKAFDIEIDQNIIIKGDEGSIKQLIVILLDNAVKYSNENGKILISVTKNDDKGLLSVFNTGEPIPKENIPYIFDRFYRVDESRSSEKEGSGLGLSIAKRIIENNEANIAVTSNSANGTTFTCTFQLSK